jgi:hypothetical protein
MDHGLGHVMATLQDSLLDSRQGDIHGVDPQEEKMHFVSLLLEPPNQAQIASARQRRLEGKGDSAPRKELDLAEN